jgi:DNA invertase Pin-like site-specific DNA recombinase
MRKICPNLAGGYFRYSCDNSSPNSIVDQMVKCLGKARAENRFVPWYYVFCDYSVSGMNTSRQGFANYKSALRDTSHFIETTYIDDFSRASRDEVEWWRLANMSRQLNKRLIGASDGFDLSSPDWDLKVSMYALLSRLFLKSLREKVLRGMRGAARRHSCLGRLSLGFTRRPRRDEHGRIIIGSHGHPVNEPCHDPVTLQYRRLLVELFIEKCWSPYRITKYFNSQKIDNWDGWTEGTIKDLLWSPTAIGVFIFNRKRHELDYESGKRITVDNPRSEWDVVYKPDLAIVTIEVWRAIRRRLAAMRKNCPLTGRPKSRNQKSATTLFSGTLFCGYCGKELVLNRSAGKYKVLSCFNGRVACHGCELTCSKSSAIVENCLLSYLQGVLFTDQSVNNFVAEANAYLAAMANKPKTDVKPLRNTIRKKEEKVKKLVDRVAKCQGNETLIRVYEQQITELGKEVDQIRVELREAESSNEVPPSPLDSNAVMSLLQDLRGLLNQEIPAAAEAIRALTGPITIRQEKTPGKEKGARWIATFSPDLIGWIRKMKPAKDYPESITLE